MAASPEHRQHDGSDSGGEEWGGISPTDGARRCKVDNCGLDLTKEKTFFSRARCCPMHAREMTVRLGGVAKRLCQQCSGFHPLADFDGTKRSCRDRLAAHKIRQREHSHRRVAQAAAAMQRRAAAETKAAVKAPPLPAAAPGVHLPDVSGVQTSTGIVSQWGQQPHSGGAPLGMPWPQAPLQQLPLWQQDKDTMNSLAAQRAVLHTSMAAQQQQQQQQQSAAGLNQAPSIFADMPDVELPVAMHLDPQPSWDLPAADVHMSEGAWMEPPSHGSQAFGAGAAARGSRALSIGEVDLQQPLPLIERYGSEGLMLESVRSMSADATLGAGCWGGLGETRGSVGLPSRLSSMANHGSATLQHGGTLEPLCYDDGALHMAPRCDSVHQAAAHHTPARRSFITAKRASLGALRTSSAHEGLGFTGGGGRCHAASAGSGGRPNDVFRRSSLGSRSSDASSQFMDVLPAESIPAARSSERHHNIPDQYPARVPQSFKRRSLDVLPDAIVPDIDPETEDRAFAEQAPEPLFLAAQLVRDTGLQGQQLPEFSYGRSGGDPGAPAGGNPGAYLHNADAFLRLPAGRSFRKESVDEIGSAAVRALLQSDDAEAFDEVPAQLRRLACAFDRPRGAPPPAGMGRRIRCRSCDEAALRCGMLSLVAC